MKSLFSQSALVFLQFWGFEVIFEARRQNLLIFKNSVCSFYCTQNSRLHPMVSMQYVTLKLIESVEISHAPESLLHSVIYYLYYKNLHGRKPLKIFMSSASIPEPNMKNLIVDVV